MINDVFSRIHSSLGKSLFADDGALWFKGKNIDYNLSEMKKKSGQGKMVLSFQWKRLK